MALELSCTRAEADQKQLMRCRETLGTNSEAISEISKILALAGNETRLKILFLLYFLSDKYLRIDFYPVVFFPF